jgi:GT2 family glycosyltransferase
MHSIDMPPQVSFIVINWNGAAYLEECLNSLLQQTCHSFEIFVVDNGSTDHSRQLLKQFPDVKVIWNEHNRGFGPANNQALSQAQGELIAFINNDAVLENSWLENMIPDFENSEIGMAAGKTLSYFDHELIDNTGHLLYWDGVNRGRGRMQKDQGQFDSVRSALFPSGCACVFRASTLQQIGCFDEDFYLYGDDTELGLRARLAGWDCSFVPDAVAYHRYSGSSGHYDPMKFFFVERNRFWVALKYFPAELLLLNPLFSLARWFFHFLALFSGRGVSWEFAQRRSGSELLTLWWTAQVSAWRAAPRIWRKRRELEKKFRWTRRRFYQCFWPNRLGLRELTFTS